MSTLTPLSFVDDGASFTKRTPHQLRLSQVSDWLENTDSTAPHSPFSAYTGSFIDDGADLLPPRTQQPGFGTVDSRFYEEVERRDRAGAMVWNEAVQKAITGDLQRNLDKIRALGDIAMDREATKERDDRKMEGTIETVRVPVPRIWGTFIIRGDDERVIVVERDGEFDSRLPGVDEARGKRWVKAESAAASVALNNSRPWAELEEAQKRSRHDDLMSIEEAEYRQPYEGSDGENVASPTGFSMAGSACSWARGTWTSQFKSRSHSPVDGWPCSPQSTTQSAVASKLISDDANSWSKDRGNDSRGGESSDRSARRETSYPPPSRHIQGNLSPVSCYSNYRAPTVEDGRNTSSESVESFADQGWCGGDENENSTWDGFERIKTASEVSVAGSGSERSALSGGTWSHSRTSNERAGEAGAWGGQRCQPAELG